MSPKTAISVLLIMGIAMVSVFAYLLNNKEIKTTDNIKNEAIIEDNNIKAGIDDSNNSSDNTGDIGIEENPIDAPVDLNADTKKYLEEFQEKKNELNKLKELNQPDAEPQVEEEILSDLQKLRALNP